jgi:outer membrane protein assembly factor BamB/TolB-like protein/DNA-binding winged helix-turn-helix (wHTH) protein
MHDSPWSPGNDFRLGDRVVRPSLNVIDGPDGPSRVGPRAMDVLVALAARGRDVVSKQELLDAVWTDLFVGDEVLTTAVWELRRAFDDDARSPRFIATVPRRGYRLLHTVEAVVDATSEPDEDEPQPRPVVTAESARWSRAWPYAAVVVGVLAVVAVLIRWDAAAPAADGVDSLVVLPMTSLGGDPRDAALAEGLTDTLITALAKIDGLSVVSATTSMSYRDRELSLSEIGNELGVDAVVTGSLAREGDRIVLNSQLVDAESGVHLWGETYERRFEHLLDLQVEVARSIGTAIGFRLAPDPPPAATPAVLLDRGSLLSWRFGTGGEIWADPVVVGRTAVIASRDGSLYGVDVETGAEQWRVHIGDQVIATPAVRDGRGFVAAHEGVVVAVDLLDGRELWRQRLETTIEAPLAAAAGVVVACDEGGLVVALDGSSGRPLWSWEIDHGVVGVSADNGVVVAVRFDGSVSALDAVDGSELWSVPVARWLLYPAAIAKGRVLVPSSDDHLVALDLIDGGELWRTRTAAPSTPTVWRDRVLVGGEGEAVRAFDLETGAELWTHDTQGAVARPVVVDGAVVAGSRDHVLYGLDPWSGALRWRIVLGTWWTTAAAAVDGAGVVVGSLDGSVFGFNPPEEASTPVVALETEGFRPRPDTGEGRARTWDVILDDPEVVRPRLLWRIEVDGFVGHAPLITAEDVIAAVGDEIAAFDRDRGRELWRQRCPGPIGTAPVAAEESILVGDRSGVVNAFDRDSGAGRWRFTTGGDVISTPVVSDGTVFFGSRDRFLYAVDLETGQEVWRRSLDIIHAAPVVADGMVFVPSRGDRLWAVSAANGEVVWSASTADWAVADPLVWRDLILAASCDGTMSAFSRSDGRLLWNAFSGGEIWYRPALVDDAVVFGSADFHLYAVDAQTGRERWRRRTGNRVLSSVAVHDGVVMAGSHDRQLWAVDADTGQPAWRLRTTGIVGSPAVAGEILAVGSADGALYCLDLSP